MKSISTAIIGLTFSAIVTSYLYLNIIAPAIETLNQTLNVIR